MIPPPSDVVLYTVWGALLVLTSVLVVTIFVHIIINH